MSQRVTAETTKWFSPAHPPVTRRDQSGRSHSAPTGGEPRRSTGPLPFAADSVSKARTHFLSSKRGRPQPPWTKKIGWLACPRRVFGQHAERRPHHRFSYRKMLHSEPCDGASDVPASDAVTPSTQLTDLVAPDWAAALDPVGPTLTQLGQFLRAEVAAGRGYLPRGDQILRAFTVPLEQVQVLLVGQDPYPTRGHAVGLAFAVDGRVRPLPPSLTNIYRELHDDVGVPAPTHGDLSTWAQRGVLLLNRSLTVRPGQPGSHRGRGWEHLTDTAIAALSRRGGPLVAILWGRDAQSLRPALGDVPVISSPHPSPLSAARGFFGSRPFSRANRLLVEQGSQPIDWSIPAWQG